MSRCWLHPRLHPRGTTPRRLGFTLAELMVSMVVLVILLTATGSVLYFSGRLMNGQGAVDMANVLLAGDAADQVCDDLNVATNFTERTANSVAFTVPDRVNNGTPNQIRYAWSGVAGAPLTRQFCPSITPTLTAASATYTPVTILLNVSQFSLNSLFRQMGGTAAVNDFSVASFTATSPTNNGVSVDPNHWVSQQFLPTLGVGISTYSITRIQLAIEATAAQNTRYFVRVVVPNGLGQPTGTVLEEEPIYQGAMSTTKFETMTVSFKSLTGLAPTQALCIVIGGAVSGGSPSNVQNQTSLLGILGGSVMNCTSTNAGSSWTLPSATSVIAYNVYGTTP